MYVYVHKLSHAPFFTVTVNWFVNRTKQNCWPVEQFWRFEFFLALQQTKYCCKPKSQTKYCRRDISPKYIVRQHEWKTLIYFKTIWYTLWSFDLFYGTLVYFVVLVVFSSFWCIVSRLICQPWKERWCGNDIDLHMAWTQNKTKNIEGLSSAFWFGSTGLD
jgi:hypothetical protein